MNILSEVKNKPLPCPYCDSNDLLSEGSDCVLCRNYGAHGPFETPYVSAIEAWNKVPARIEEMWIPVAEWESNPNNQGENAITWRLDFEKEFQIAYYFHGLWTLWSSDISGMPGKNIPKPEFVKPLPFPPNPISTTYSDNVLSGKIN